MKSHPTRNVSFSKKNTEKWRKPVNVERQTSRTLRKRTGKGAATAAVLFFFACARSNETPFKNKTRWTRSRNQCHHRPAPSLQTRGTQYLEKQICRNLEWEQTMRPQDFPMRFQVNGLRSIYAVGSVPRCPRSRNAPPAECRRHKRPPSRSRGPAATSIWGTC